MTVDWGWVSGERRVWWGGLWALLSLSDLIWIQFISSNTTDPERLKTRPHFYIFQLEFTQFCLSWLCQVSSSPVLVSSLSQPAPPPATELCCLGNFTFLLAARYYSDIVRPLYRQCCTLHCLYTDTHYTMELY